MAGGIVRGRVRTTMESRKMAAILQLKSWQRDLQPPSLILDIYVMVNYTCQNKDFADQYHMTISQAEG